MIIKGSVSIVDQTFDFPLHYFHQQAHQHQEEQPMIPNQDTLKAQPPQYQCGLIGGIAR